MTVTGYLGEGKKEEGEVEILSNSLFLALATDSMMVPFVLHSLAIIYPCQVFDFLLFQG